MTNTFIRRISLSIGVPILFALGMIWLPSSFSVLGVVTFITYAIALLFLVTADLMPTGDLMLGYGFAKWLLARLALSPGRSFCSVVSTQSLAGNLAHYQYFTSTDEITGYCIPPILRSSCQENCCTGVVCLRLIKVWIIRKFFVI